jgi:ABC-type spermidine/putrescine transport system permease subunit II
MPAVVSGALLAFALSFDDYVVTTFNAGVGSSTLPLFIYGKVKFGVTPEINAISTIIVTVTAVAVLIAWRVGARRADERLAVAEPEAPAAG